MLSLYKVILCLDKVCLFQKFRYYIDIKYLFQHSYRMICKQIFGGYQAFPITLGIQWQEGFLVGGLRRGKLDFTALMRNH